MLFLEAILIIISLAYLWRLTGSRSFPAPQFVLAIFYVGYIYLGYLFMLDDPYYSRQDVLGSVGLLVRLGYLAVIVASILTTKIKIGINGCDFHGVNCLGLLNDKAGVAILTAFSILACFIYFLTIPVSPLVMMFSDPGEVHFSRESATTGMKGFGILSTFFYIFMPFCWSYLYLKGARAWVFVFALNFSTLLATGQKSPIVYFLILFFVVQGLKNGRVNYAKILNYSFASIIALILLVYVQNRHLFDSLDIEAVAGSSYALFRRIFIVGAETIVNYLIVFPGLHDYMAIGSERPSDQIVYENIYGSDIIGTVNSVSLSMFYAYTGNIYLSSGLFFLVLVLLFLVPLLIRWLFVDGTSRFAAVGLYYLLVVKMVVTDWYTLIPDFFMTIMVIAGLFNVIRQVKLGRGTTSGNSLGVSSLSFVVSFLMLLYFLQGQAKQALLG
jgi:hypothetical protein